MNTKEQPLTMQGFMKLCEASLLTWAVGQASWQESITPLLQWMGGVGSGLIAFQLMLALQNNFSLITFISNLMEGGRVARFFGGILQFCFFYKGRSITAMIVSVALSALAQLALELISGKPLNVATTAIIAYIISQLKYYSVYNYPFPEVEIAEPEAADPAIEVQHVESTQ